MSSVLVVLLIIAIFACSWIKRARRHRKELEEIAYTDRLTGGTNATKFKELVVSEEREGTLVSMDIHNFKVVNIACGSVAGDAVLRRVWDIVNEHVGAEGHAAHVGGDQYVIWIPSQDRRRVFELAGSLSRRIAAVAAKLNTPPLEARFGAFSWKPGDDIERAQASAVLAKRMLSGNAERHIGFYDDVDVERMSAESEMEDAFEHAILCHEFEAWLQPKVSVETGELAGAEALVRWRREDGSLVPPGVFVPLFERNGMVSTLDEFIFKTVCKQQAAWSAQGRKVVPVSVNLSRASMYARGVVERYVDIAQYEGIAPSLVPIEVTETTAVSDKALGDVAAAFCGQGFCLHMDDFGTGYSSLSSLTAMSFETLKLDRSLINQIGTKGGESLLRHTIELAHELGLCVVAEGVEEQSQVDDLRVLKCDQIQGYFYSKPLPISEFEEAWL